MELEVLKFGGSSLATAAAMERVAQVLWERRDTRRVVVCSAMGGVTNDLLELGRAAARREAGCAERLAQIAGRHRAAWGAAAGGAENGAPDFEGLLEALAAHVQGIQLLAEFSARSADALAAFGEQLAVRIVEALLVGRGLRVVRVDARDWVATDGGYGAALVERERTRAAIAQGVAAAGTGWDILLTEGFIGRAPDGSTTTLGRGGSDYTASLIARDSRISFAASLPLRTRACTTPRLLSAIDVAG
jgi:aspartokinase/homoserine dehydrogenase 1